jgi:methylglutaconyl-CoA hydratase
LTAPDSASRVRITDHGDVREIRLTRPDRHNALNEETIRVLAEAFLAVSTASSASPRAVLLSAEGKSFCAGADVEYMRRIADHPLEENLADARNLAALFGAVRSCPCLVVARVQGAALGGGSGLVAACDLVVASDEARFGFTEVRLGLVPATISPFVVERIGPVRARALFATGEIFGAAEAQRIGLVDRVTPPGELSAEVDRILASVLSAAPLASREAKRLADRVGRRFTGTPLDPYLANESARLIAEMRSRTEGREGLQAFLEKRRAAWVREWPPAAGSAGSDSTPVN